jgi:hypothetical protein
VKIKNDGKWDLRLISAGGMTILGPGAMTELPGGSDVLVSAFVSAERFAAEERLEIVRRVIGTADSERRNVEGKNG